MPLIERFEERREAASYIFKARYDNLLTFHVGTVTAQMFAGAFESEALVFYQELDYLQQLDVVGRVVACAASTAARPQFREFLFPKTDCGLRQVEQFGHVADTVEFFCQFVGHDF